MAADHNEDGEPRQITSATDSDQEKLRRLIAAVDEIERLLKSYERSRWLWAGIGIWVKWFGIVGTALVASRLLWVEIKQMILALQ